MPTKSNKKVLTVNPPAAGGTYTNLRSKLPAAKIGHVYVLASVLVLALTSLMWAILGAKLQQNNADQLANPYLFEHLSTIHQSTLPGAHSFLIKWPLFFAVKLFGLSAGAYITVTVLAVLATVGILAFILSRIERRPAYFALLCLALASVLLLIPSQPYPGALLPVNMAMLATRNLEYVAYIGALVLLVKSSRMRDWRFWLSAASLGVLAASDKLFLALSLSGSLLALVIYSLRRKWGGVSLNSGWFISSIGGGALAAIIIAVVGHGGFTHISAQQASLPYSIVDSGKNLVLGVIYAILGVLTNFGADPAYSSTYVRHIPHQFFAGIFSLSGPAYLINLGIFGALLAAGYILLKKSLNERRAGRPSQDIYTPLSLLLLWSSVAALGVFTLTDHYYAVDARYLGITLFALFVSAATVLRGRNWQQRNLQIIGAVLVVGIGFGIVSNIRTYDSQRDASAVFNQRDHVVAQALARHPEDVLVGDYWRVLPIRHDSGNKLNVMPLQTCTQPRDLLSSKAWQADLNKHSFGYLLSMEHGPADFPTCSFAQILSAYGRPNTSVLIAGSFSKPKELLLLYDHGRRIVQPTTASKAAAPATILPINLSDLPSVSCPVPTSLNIVAHQDDDLLFMNPDIEDDIDRGYCVRTIYVTAGDSGSGQYYWLTREQGTEAAYSHMLGKKVLWIEKIVKVSDDEYVKIANPKGNTKISLVFVHLPDGGLKGNGFAMDSSESLQKLDSGAIKTIHSVDRQSSYSSQDLISMLSLFMHAYQPSVIRTQANFASQRYPDHSDHMAVGRFVKKAYALYEKQQFDGQVTIPLSFYIGYPVHERPANISDGELQEKLAIFLEYAKFDKVVCQSAVQCSSGVYGSYLARQYKNGY